MGKAYVLSGESQCQQLVKGEVRGREDGGKQTVSLSQRPKGKVSKHEDMGLSRERHENPGSGASSSPVVELASEPDSFPNQIGPFH